MSEAVELSELGAELDAGNTRLGNNLGNKLSETDRLPAAETPMNPGHANSATPHWSGCGPGGRGFESPRSPLENGLQRRTFRRCGRIASSGRRLRSRRSWVRGPSSTATRPIQASVFLAPWRRRGNSWGTSSVRVVTVAGDALRTRWAGDVQRRGVAARRGRSGSGGTGHEPTRWPHPIRVKRGCYRAPEKPFSLGHARGTEGVASLRA